MNVKNPFPYDIEEIVTETEARLVNGLLKKGLVLLDVYHVGDNAGGYFAVYVLGRRRVATVHAKPEYDFDQRREG